MCICKCFLPIHKYNDIGEIYYLIQLRLLYKFRYALSKIRDFSISQMLLVWWWTNFHTIIMRFFSTVIIGFESFGAIFMSKNQWFLQGLQKKAFLVLIPLRFFKLWITRKILVRLKFIRSNKMCITSFYTSILCLESFRLIV